MNGTLRERLASCGHLISNSLRWIFIFLMFFYLFALVMTLIEALSFQKLVGKLVDGDASRARAVLLAVHAAQSEARRTEQTGLPFGQIAVKIDALHAVSEKLHGIEAKNFNYTRDRRDPKERLRIQVDRLLLNASDLRAMLHDHRERKGLVLAESLSALEGDINDIRQFQVGQVDPTEEVGPDTDFGSVSDPVDNLPTGADRNEPGWVGATVAESLAQPETDETPLVTETADVKRAFEEAIVQLENSFEQVDGLVEISGGDEVLQRQLAKLDTAVEDLVALKIRRGQPIAYNPRDEIPEGDSQGQFDAIVNAIDDAVQGMTQVLVAENQALDQARRVSRPVSAIISAANELGALEVRADDSGEILGPDILLFNTAKGELARAVQQLEETLGTLTPEIGISHAIGDDGARLAKANFIWRDFNAIGRFEGVLQPFYGLRENETHFLGGGFRWLSDLGFEPKGLATLGNETLNVMVVFVMGAIGSLIYLTKYQLLQTLQGASSKHPPTRSLAWYIFRPVFGIVIAFAIYLLYKAGQLALGGGGGSVLRADVNVPILSVISLFAGLMSWQALDAVETKGKAWLSSRQRSNLWATGLDNALRNANRSIAECANQIGRSAAQVERWIERVDKVTPEMQDRIVTWLDKPHAELFSSTEIRGDEEKKSLWASGLQDALKRAQLDEEGLAEILEENPERIRQWRDRELQVTPSMQIRLTQVLGVRPSELFDASKQDNAVWAVGLRLGLRRSGFGSTETLADRIGSTAASVRAWMELENPIPAAMQHEIQRVLGISYNQLFNRNPPKRERFRWAVSLRPAMLSKGINARGLAEGIDAEESKVHAWMELDESRGQVAPATQNSLSEFLGLGPSELFARERPEAFFRWTSRMCGTLLATVEARQNLINKIDVPGGMLEDWLAHRRRVAPETQRRIAEALKKTVDELFVSAIPANEGGQGRPNDDGENRPG